MSAIETRHEIIEMLFNIKNGATLEYVKNILAELKDHNSEGDVLPAEVLNIIEKSEHGFANGKYSTLEEFRAKRADWMSALKNK